MSGPSGAARSHKAPLLLALGVLILFLDGYDLFVFGAAAPAMLEYEAWEVTPVTVGLIGSITTLGMPLGAISTGYAADVYGRRLPIIVSLIWVSACMFASFLAPSLEFFMATRFAVGLGLGALIPLTCAFVNDWAPEGRRAFYTGTALTGVAFGGLAASFTARALLPEVHFQWLFFFGCLPLVLVPVVWRLLPAGLPARDPADATEPSSADQGSGQEKSKIRQIFAPGLARATIAFWVATFLGLILVNGASTWLPTLMVNSGYDIRSSLEFAVTFNIGAIVGTLGATLIADRGSLKWVTVVSFVFAAISMFVLSTPQPRVLLLLMAAVAGLGALGTQNLINAYVGQYYPARVRGTALGFSLGVGRLGSIAGPSYLAAVTVLFVNPDAGFYAFMIPALLGALVIATVPFRGRTKPVTAGSTKGE